ncbi:MAG: hypothetical protein AB8G22_07265 [Saprospiraceae bacterium]
MRNIFLLLISLLLFSQCSREQTSIKPKAIQTIVVDDSKYEEHSNTQHYVMLFASENAHLMERATMVKQFNQANGFDTLRVSHIYVPNGNNKKPIVTIRAFNNFSAAKKYIEILEQQQFINTSERIFAFSKDNFRRFLTMKNVEEYEVFYLTIN